MSNSSVGQLVRAVVAAVFAAAVVSTASVGVAHADTQERNACLFNRPGSGVTLAEYWADEANGCEDLQFMTIGDGGGGCGGCDDHMKPQVEAPEPEEIP